MIFLLSNLRYILGGIAIVVSFAAGWHLKSFIIQEEQLRAARQANKIAAEYETKVQVLSKHALELNQKLETSLAKPIYTDCTLTPDVVRLLNSTPR